ncbi:DUF4261 domain-containing protein [Candidatus Sumerlaeota bacterium]|nr:DUF4261 domain-containing protein [Candidatus Sumerlaeota bacterium]
MGLPIVGRAKFPIDSKHGESHPDPQQVHRGTRSWQEEEHHGMSPRSNNSPKVPFQFDVYFNSFPNIDCEQLVRFVRESDPDERDQFDLCAAAVDTPSSPQIKTFAGKLGDFQIAILVHDAPSPAAGIIAQSRLPEPVKKELLGHRAFAMINILGGDQYPPFEAVILLHKISLGFCQQGALGAANIHTGQCFPAGLLQEVSRAGLNPPKGEPPRTLWAIIRDEHEPFDLLADIVGFETQGSKWLVTTGFSFCGFPDLVAQFKERAEAEELCQAFRNAFDYCMSNGPVFMPGHTMGVDENISYKFMEAPPDLDLPRERYGLLMMERCVTPRKKRFGIL